MSSTTGTTTTTTSTATTPAPRVLVIVTYEVGEEDRTAFERIAGAHVAAADTYPGCLRFSLGHDVLDPGRYELVELWQGQADLDAHSTSAAFGRTMAALAECRTLRVRPDRYEIAGPS
jgi:quinol monooxygenase YgiN